MKRFSLALAVSLAAISLASADSFTDGGGTVWQGTVDVSRTAHAAIQCNLTVTATATSLAALWTTAGCPTSLPSAAQFAWVEPTGGQIWYSTNGQAPVASNATGTASFPILTNQAWPIEGRLSINALQLIAASSVAVSVEVRY